MLLWMQSIISVQIQLDQVFEGLENNLNQEKKGMIVMEETKTMNLKMASEPELWQNDK